MVRVEISRTETQKVSLLVSLSQISTVVNAQEDSNILRIFTISIGSMRILQKWTDCYYITWQLFSFCKKRGRHKRVHIRNKTDFELTDIKNIDSYI